MTSSPRTRSGSDRRVEPCAISTRSNGTSKEGRMGAWGAGIFDNDDAADWVYELEQAGDDSVLAETLAAVANAGADAYVEAPDAAAALAAAAVVAAALTGS